MKITKLFVKSNLVLLGASLLFGGVLAAGGWAVKDEANNLNARLTLQSTAEVTFYDYDGSVLHSEILLKGETLNTVPTPTHSGYVFDGWSTSNSTYTRVTENLATKEFTVDTEYYPRFASYGYKVGSGSATHIVNSQSATPDLTSIASNTTVDLGTFIHNKTTSLENATNVTLSNAGDYSLVCHGGGDWVDSTSGTLGNWSIQRKYIVTATNEWIGRRIYAWFKDSLGNVLNEYFLVSTGTTNQYYTYGNYDAVKVEFGALYTDTLVTDHVLDGRTNVEFYTDDIALSSAVTAYTLAGPTYYLTGSFGDVDWDMDNNYVLTVDSSDSNHYYINNISLNAGDKIKVLSNYHQWFTSGTYEGCCYTNDGDQNIVLNTTGIYDISLYVDGTNHVIPTPVSYESTFTAVHDSLAANEDIYLVGFSDTWTINNTYKLNATGTADTYSLTTNVPADTDRFKFVVYNGTDINWTIFTSDDITYTPGESYNVEYHEPQEDTRTLNLYFDYSSTYTDGRYWWNDGNKVTSVYAYTSAEGDGAYYPATIITTWDGKKDHIQVTLPITCTKLKVSRCDPSQCTGGIPNSSSAVWNSSGYFSITSNDYVDCWFSN